ncbi:MAG: response regulator [Methanobacterium sp.]
MDILIVDESSTTSDLKNILGKLGYKISSIASTGEEAIQKTAELKPDLIFINIKLKGEVSGVEAATRISKLHKIPIIFLTVFIKNCLIKSLQLPEDAIVLSKPIKQENLEYCISRAFSNDK